MFAREWTDDGPDASGDVPVSEPDCPHCGIRMPNHPTHHAQSCPNSGSDVQGVRCSLRLAGPEFNAHAESEIPKGTRIFCEYPPYEFGEHVAHSLAAEAQAARREAVDQYLHEHLSGWPVQERVALADAVLRVLGLAS